MLKLVRSLERRVVFKTLALLLCVGVSSKRLDADWLRFRGNDGTSSAESNLPTEWSVEDNKNIAWTVELPGKGPSSPIIVNGRVIVTASSGNNESRMHIIAFDEKTGEKLWERNFWATGRTYCHPTSSNAAPTPVSDGNYIFALFSSCDMVCLDLDGNVKWVRGLALDHPKAGNDVGMSTSPVVLGDLVIAQIECQGDSFVEAIQIKDGKTRWSIPREKYANWCTPIAMYPGTQEPQLVLQSRSSISLHNHKTGQVIWEKKIPCDTISSCCIVDDKLVVPSNGMTVFKPSNATESDVVWNESTLRPGSASAAVSGDRLYVINRAGVLNCADLATGNALWKLRLSGAFWATPLVANGKLYAIADKGKVIVVDVSGEKGKIVETNDFAEGLLASPAAVGDAIYFRSNQHLWKVSSMKDL